MSVFVGLDCGGSSTRVLALDSDGNLLFQGQSGAANLVSTPEPRLVKNLAQALEGCPSASHVCGCFAGLVSEEIRVRGSTHLKRLFPRAVVRAEPDYTAAFYASPPGTDICVIAGTGSLVCSRTAEGMVKSGGKGYILGDEGSGFHYGRDALVHFLDDPNEASSRLKSEIERIFGSFSDSDIVPQVYRTSTPAMLLAKLTKVLAADARAGEPYAVESIRINSMKLAHIVARHTLTHLPEKGQLNICLAGGIWKASPDFKEQLELGVQSLLPNRQITIYRIMKPPVHGAVELAKELSIGN